MESTPARRGSRVSRAVVALAGIALVAGCSSSGSSSSPTTAGSSTPSGATASPATPAAAGTPSTAPNTTTPTQSAAAAKAFTDPCGLVAIADVQVALPGSPAGTAPVVSASAAMCKFEVDSDHRIIISLATGPADTMAKTKAAVASLGQTKVDGLGDVAYSATIDARLDVHFFQGTTEVLISGFGLPGGMDSLVALAKKVSASL